MVPKRPCLNFDNKWFMVHGSCLKAHDGKSSGPGVVVFSMAHASKLMMGNPVVPEWLFFNFNHEWFMFHGSWLKAHGGKSSGPEAVSFP